MAGKLVEGFGMVQQEAVATLWGAVAVAQPV